MPSLSDEVPTRSSDALSELPGLFLSDGSQDVVGKFADDAAFSDGVDRCSELLELFVSSDALSDAPSKTVQGSDHDDGRSPFERETTNGEQETLIPWPIIAPARLDVLELVSEGPSVTLHVAAALGYLSVERDTFVRLIVSADATVDQRGSIGRTADAGRRTSRHGRC